MSKLMSSTIATVLTLMITMLIAIPRDAEKTAEAISKSAETVTYTSVKVTIPELKNPLTTTTTTTTTTTKRQYNYSDDDLYVLSHCMYGEAGGHSEKLLSYVGSVVLNRVKHKSFPNTIRGVVFQKGQYACTWDGNYNKTPDSLTMRVARNLLANGSVLPANVVYQAGFRQGSGTYAVVDGVYFCYA